MRVVIFSISFCEYIIQLANAMSRHGSRMLIILPKQLVDSTVGSDLRNLLDREVECKYIDLRERRSVSHYTALIRAVTSFNPDLIHIQDNGELETFLIVVALRRIRIALTIHDVVYHPGTDSDVPLHKKIIKKYIRKRAAAIHVHSNYSKDLMNRLSPALAEKCVVIPHGTLTLFKYWEKDTVHEEANTCLFFGRMAAYRGLDLLVKHADAIAEMMPGLKIIIAGSGPELMKYKKEIQNNALFELHDAFIQNSEVYRLFRRASLVLLPYSEASQSGVLSMAMAFETTVVATRVGSLPEYIAHGLHGLLVDVHDHISFMKAMKHLLECPNVRRKMKDNCRLVAKQNDFLKLAERYHKFYTQAMVL